MLDVLHFLLEEDQQVSNESELYVRSYVRSTMYSALYGRTYANAMKPRESAQGEVPDYGPEEYTPAEAPSVNDPLVPEGEADMPFDPRKKMKPPLTQPAAQFDPTAGRFPGLDAPLN